MSGFFNECFKFLKSLIRADIGIGGNESCLVCFYAGNHLCLLFNSLRAENKRYTAFLCQRDSHLVI